MATMATKKAAKKKPVKTRVKEKKAPQKETKTRTIHLSEPSMFYGKILFFPTLPKTSVLFCTIGGVHSKYQSNITRFPSDKLSIKSWHLNPNHRPIIHTTLNHFGV